nr:hypothetical protein [Acidilobus sp.]
MTRLSDLLGYGPRPGEVVLEVPGPLQEAEVVRRPNRFAVELRGGLICHLHDPGRLPE